MFSKVEGRRRYGVLGTHCPAARQPVLWGSNGLCIASVCLAQGPARWALHNGEGWIARVDREQAADGGNVRLQLPHAPYPLLDFGNDLRLAVTCFDLHILSELLHERQKRTCLATGDAVSLKPGDGFARLRQDAPQGGRLVRGKPLTWQSNRPRRTAYTVCRSLAEGSRGVDMPEQGQESCHRRAGALSPFSYLAYRQRAGSQSDPDVVTEHAVTRQCVLYRTEGLSQGRRHVAALCTWQTHNAQSPSGWPRAPLV